MSLNPKITVREFTKFRDPGDGASAIAVVNPDGTNIGGSSSSSGGTVFQGTNPWIVSTSSLPTITIGNIINSLVTVNNSQATITLGQMIPAGTNFVGLATVVVGNYINLASGASTLADTLPNPSLQQIATFPYVWFNNNATWERWRQIDSSVVGTTTGRGVAGVGAYGQFDDTSTTTLAENSFGLMRMSANRNQYVTIRDAAGNERGLNIDAGGNLNSLGTVIIGSALPAGSNHVGSVTIFGSITSNTGMTTLFPGPNFIGLTTTVIGSAPTLYAVVNTGAVGVQNSLVTLLNSSNWIGLATVSVGSSPTLFAVVNTVAAGVQNSMVTLLAGPNQIGSVTIANNPTLGTGSNYIGLATVVQANQPALVASSAYVGLASVNIGGTLPALSAGSNFIGLATVVQGNQPALVASSAFIGLATTVNASSSAWIGLVTAYPGSAITSYSVPISTYTSLSTVLSASGNATIFVPPVGQRWILKDLMIGTQGGVVVSILSGTKTVIPPMSLATQSGYINNFGDSGFRGSAINDSFVVNLGSAATVSVMTNVRFDL